MEQAFQALLEEWKGVKGNVIPLLQKTQDIFGFLPQDAMREIARGHRQEPPRRSTAWPRSTPSSASPPWEST